MTSRNVKAFLLARLRQKLREIAGLLAAALALSAVLALVGLLVLLLLPSSWADAVRSLNLKPNAASLARIRDALGSDWRGGAAFFGLQVLQVVLAPIPGQLVAFAGGAVFGFWKGLAITMAGVEVGSLAAILLARRFGRPAVDRFVPASAAQKFSYLLNDRSGAGFFALFLLPAVPDDALCFLAGLTSVPLRRMMGLCLLGRLPGFAVLCFAGAGAGQGGWAAPAVFVAAVSVGLAGWFFSDELVDLATRTSSRWGRR